MDQHAHHLRNNPQINKYLSKQKQEQQLTKI